MQRLIRRIAWGSSESGGSVHLELGEGELEGATLTIDCSHGNLRVVLDAPVGVDTLAWEARFRAALAGRGLSVESMEVR
jgi:hypothetical protein